tara:strand:+ start:680 stop:1540 length:861 start_codon:yes stop_codon:yes gene_type:complete
VSAIIPTYNRLPKLLKAVESVLSQTYKELEVIVVDDGSEDGTREYFENESLDPRVRYFYKENEGLPSLSRNLGATKSRGKYLAFLDSDDLWEETKIQTQVEFLEDNKAYTFAYSQARAPNGSFVSGFSIRKSGAIESSLLFRNFIITSSVCVRTESFIAASGFPIDKRIVVAEDYSLWLKLSKLGLGKYFSQPLVVYELEGGISSENISRNLSCYYTVTLQGLKSSKVSPLYYEFIILMYWLRRLNASRTNKRLLQESLESIEYLESNFASRLALELFSTFRGLWR